MKEARVVRVEEATKRGGLSRRLNDGLIVTRLGPISHAAFEQPHSSNVFSNRTVPLTPPSLVKLSCIAASLLTAWRFQFPAATRFQN